MINDKFIMKIQKHNENVKKYRNISNLISTTRLITFLMIISFTYMIIKINHGTIYIIADCILAILFISLIIYHDITEGKLNFSKEMININNKYLARMDGKWVDFNDIGEEFIDKKHEYSFDLDIVGEKSLFQLINVTNTWNGRAILAKTLLQAQYDGNEIKLRQQAIKELSTKLDFCQELQFLSGKHKGELQNPEKLIKYAESKETAVKSQKIRI